MKRKVYREPSVVSGSQWVFAKIAAEELRDRVVRTALEDAMDGMCPTAGPTARDVSAGYYMPAIRRHES